MYYLIAFYQRVVELWCHATNFPNDPRIIYTSMASKAVGQHFKLLIKCSMKWRRLRFTSVDKYRNRDKLVVVTSLKIVISKQCKSKTWLKELYSEFWKSKSLRVATLGMKCINSAWCKTTRSGWLYKDNRGSLYKFQAVYHKWLYECQSISSSGFHHFYSPQT